MQNPDNAQDNSNEIKSSVSLFHPSNLIYDLGQIVFAPFKKLFSKSPFEEHNFGVTENDICKDLSEYFQGTYERALIGESFDVNLQAPIKIANQEEPKMNIDFISTDIKGKDNDTPNVIEEDPSIRIY